MDKLEYFILDVVKVCTVPLHFLTDKKYLFNEGIKIDYEIDELVEKLYKLFSEELISTYRVSKPTTLMLSKEEIKDQLCNSVYKNPYNYEKYIRYKITEKGGKLWEKYSNPNWDKFIEAGHFTEPDYGWIISTSQDLTKHYFDVQLQRYPDNIVKDSIEWNKLEPWDATHWKTLPIGYELKFDMNFREWIDVDLNQDYPVWYSSFLDL